jgi:hypothetical protein
MKRSSCLDAVLVELAKHGIRSQISNGGKHYRVRWMTPRSERRTVTVSVSPSDWRAPRRARSDVRRILRRDQMLRT